MRKQIRQFAENKPNSERHKRTQHPRQLKMRINQNLVSVLFTAVTKLRKTSLRGGGAWLSNLISKTVLKLNIKTKKKPKSKRSGRLGNPRDAIKIGPFLLPALRSPRSVKLTFNQRKAGPWWHTKKRSRLEAVPLSKPGFWLAVRRLSRF